MVEVLTQEDVAVSAVDVAAMELNFMVNLPLDRLMEVVL